MGVLVVLAAVFAVAKVLYVGTALLQRGEDPRFEGDRIVYRS